MMDVRRSRATRWGLLVLLLLGGTLAAYALATSSPTVAGRQAAAQGTSQVQGPQGAAANAGGGGTDNCVQPSSNTGNCAGTFAVTVGNLTGLVPTRTVQLPVSYANPNAFDILIDSYTVTASVAKAGCNAAALQVPGKVMLTGTNRIAVVGKRSTTTSVPVTLLNTATDACQGARFTLNVSATGVKK